MALTIHSRTKAISMIEGSLKGARLVRIQIVYVCERAIQRDSQTERQIQTKRQGGTSFLRNSAVKNINEHSIFKATH